MRHNYRKYPNKNVEECKSLCSQNVKCLAFEYGVAYGGSGIGGTRPRDCWLQDSADKADCDGVFWNSDLYVKRNSHILSPSR